MTPQTSITIHWLRRLPLLAAAVWLASCRTGFDPGQAREVSRIPIIAPDYTSIVIPANIAPINFVVREPGRRYFVRIHAARGRPLEISSRSPEIVIPPRPWRALLQENRGEILLLDVWVRDERGDWQRFRTVSNRIAPEEVDGHMAYRLMKPIYSYWKSIGIYQRDLENYDQKVILHGSSFGNGCVNCHTFLANRPERMFIGVRSMGFGSATLLADFDRVVKIGAKWGYTSWHPSGRFATYPVMSVNQFFHSAGMEIRDVVDQDSVMLAYDVEEKKVKTDKGFSDKQRLESYPTWSPDGRTMYFCSAAIPWTDRSRVPPEGYDQVRYDLRRIAYDPDSDSWGEPETLISSGDTGKSILEPRISPDGRFLLFCMCRYGVFPVFQPSSDLYLMELASGTYRRLSINSEFSESWHSWSSNSRWIVFSSKRLGGLFTRPFISYIDPSGRVHKPFLLPQKDPRFYESYLKTFSVPEFITGPVTVSPRALAAAVRSSRKIVVDTFSGATPKGPKSKAPIRE